jgi:hypothetical protein
MGLRFFSVTGRRWVRRNADLIFESGHPLEKSAPGFVDTNSYYPLSRLEETLFGSSRTEHCIVGVSADSYPVWVAWVT